MTDTFWACLAQGHGAYVRKAKMVDKHFLGMFHYGTCLPTQHSGSRPIWLHSEFQVNLSYKEIPVSKKQKKRKGKTKDFRQECL
jgi:hypothetical protein